MEYLKKPEVKLMMLKVKKILVFVSLAMASILFIYALSFFTDLYMIEIDMNYIELFKKMQVFNKQLFNYTVLLMISVVLLFIFRTQIRKKLYLTNIVVGFSTVIFGFLNSIYIFLNIFTFKSDYQKVDPTYTLVFYPKFQKNYFIFNLGAIVAIIQILVSVALLGVIIYYLIINAKELKSDLVAIKNFIFRKKDKRGEVSE